MARKGSTRWIVTLDVLKLEYVAFPAVFLFSWIVTLDVLKYTRCVYTSKTSIVE